MQNPNASTKVEHIAAAEAALSNAYSLADANPNYPLSPDFWTLLASTHVGIAGLK